MIHFSQFRRLRAGLLLASLVLLLGTAHAQTERPATAAFRAELNGPVAVLLSNGSRQTGRIVGWDGQQLRLEVELGGGSAEVTYPASDLRSMSFPGRLALEQLAEWTRDPERAEDALDLFRAFYQQRGAFLQYLDPAELNLFTEYVRFALQHDRPLRAVAIIETLRPHIQDPTRLKDLDDAVLMAFFQAGMLDEASAKARAWIAAAPPAGSSALGWRILADIQFRAKAYEEALWTALYPIAFANQILPEHLDLCYALAIAAAQETRQADIAERLTSEMRQRDLPWPTQHALLQPYEPAPPPPEGEAPPEAPQNNNDPLLEPIQTPSPLDPLQSLPTRIRTRAET